MPKSIQNVFFFKIISNAAVWYFGPLNFPFYIDCHCTKRFKKYFDLKIILKAYFNINLNMDTSDKEVSEIKAFVIRLKGFTVYIYLVK